MQNFTVKQMATEQKQQTNFKGQYPQVLRPLFTNSWKQSSPNCMLYTKKEQQRHTLPPYVVSNALLAAVSFAQQTSHLA